MDKAQGPAEGMCPEPGCVLSFHAHGRHMTADEQEAQSIRYTDSLRIVPLSSGRFALWTLAGGAKPKIVDRLDPEEIREMHRAQREAYERGKERFIVRKAQAPQAGKLSIDLDQLFGKGSKA